MSEHPLSGGPNLPSPNPGSPGSPSSHDAAGTQKRRTVPSSSRSAQSGFGAGLDPDGGPSLTAASGASGSAGAAPARPRRRRRGSRGGRRRTKKTTGDSTVDQAEGPTESPESTAKPSANGRTAGRKRGKRGGRRRKKTSAAVEIEAIPGEEDELPTLAELPPDAELVGDESKGGGKTAKKGRSRSKAGRKTRKREKPERKRERRQTRGRKRAAEPEDEEVREETRPKHRIILVNGADPEETRVTVVEDGKISDLQMTVKKQVSFVSDIYRGRVVNLEPAIGAAFVDFGQGRNGFLHASDVMPRYADDDWSLDKLLHTPVESEAFDGDEDEEAVEGDEAEAQSPEPARRGKGRGRGRPKGRKLLAIDKLVRKGQMVAVQITKDAIGDKGPTLTTYISIPGRYLVLMPSLQRTGVSRKIDDEKERRRLKRILTSLNIPEGMGVIVRTAGVGKTKAELKRDLDYLLLAWEDFAKRLKNGRNPAPLYQESDVAIRTMRDLFTSDTESVVVDDLEEYERMVAFTQKLMPEHVDRVKQHDGPRPLLHTYGVEQDFEKIFSRRVELPSGGSIVIDQTEALVAIDVNSGRTREEGADFEDIALKTNLEAAPEIARQIRLRDLGGIIVLDYIDMMRTNNRRQVERATRDALRADRARSKIGRVSQFGLLELTRQRLGPGLNKLVYDTCRRCRGSGRQRTASSRAQAILRRLGTALSLKGFTEVEVRAHPEVIDYLKANLSRELQALEEKSGRKLTMLAVPDQVEDSVLHYLRADGREVRPGGRRKR